MYIYIDIDIMMHNVYYLNFTVKEYGKADRRLLNAPPTILSTHIISSTLVTLLDVLLIYAAILDKPWRHFVQIILSVVHMYGGQ